MEKSELPNVLAAVDVLLDVLHVDAVQKQDDFDGEIRIAKCTRCC